MRVLTATRVKLTQGEDACLWGKGPKNLEAYLKMLEAGKVRQTYAGCPARSFFEGGEMARILVIDDDLQVREMPTKPFEPFCQSSIKNPARSNIH